MEMLPIAGWQCPGQFEELMVLLGHPVGPEQPAHTGIRRAHPVAWESPQLLGLCAEEARGWIPKFSYCGKCVSLEETFLVSAVHLIVKMNSYFITNN